LKHELNSIRRLFVALCAALAFACHARAQEAGPHVEKLSDYVNQFTTCNAGAHLDNLAIYLQNNPTATGYLRIYGPGGPDDSFGKRAAVATKSYLVVTRGIDESRVKAIYAGRYEHMDELLTEVWLVPAGAELPPPSKYEPDFKFEGKFAEINTWDGPDEHEGWSTSTEVALVGLSDLMRRRAEARAYLVAYQTDESAPGAWRRAADRQRERLAGNGVSPERMKAIFGGYAEEETVKVWILPAGAPPPAKQKRERRPEQSVRIASLEDWQLKYGDNERWGFKGLAGLLKSDPQLTGFIVVRQAPPKLGAVDPERPVDPDETPDVDVLKLAEEWKQELKKSGVAEHRLIVMVVPAKADQTNGELETWVVPPGAPLPDPSADDSATGDAEEEVNP
jgi:hypothetical protein